MSEHVDRPMLRKLATRMGIIDSYVDQTGDSVRYTSDETRVSLLAAMGYDASTEEKCRDTMKALRKKRLSRWIAPVRVIEQGDRKLSRVAVRVPRLDAEEVKWTLVLRTEEGNEQRWEGTTHGGAAHREELNLPAVPPLGYHELHVAAWKYSVRGVRGHEVPVYLLDTNLPDNSEWDRTLTDYLYGGDEHYRLCQEIVLGMAHRHSRNCVCHGVVG